MPSFSDVTLPTERLTLRPFRPADAPALFSIFSDKEVTRFWSRPAWTELAQAEQRIARDIAAMESGEHVRFALERREDSAVVGECCLFAWNRDNRRAELGYALARAAWGKGYMNEALRAFVDFAFGKLELNRLEADIDPRNTASARSLQRLGFKQEGLLRERWIVGGEVSDTALYGLLAKDHSGGRPAHFQML